MKIERLLYQVRPEEFAKDFLQVDAQVWTPWLQRQKGFLNKTTRILPQGQIELLIFWASAEDKKRAENKKQELKQVENLMKSRAPGVYHLIQSSVLSSQ